MARRIRGHRVVLNRDPYRWACSCGEPLNGGPLGDGRRGAYDVQRFHLLDVETGRDRYAPPPGADERREQR